MGESYRDGSIRMSLRTVGIRQLANIKSIHNVAGVKTAIRNSSTLYIYIYFFFLGQCWGKFLIANLGFLSFRCALPMELTFFSRPKGEKEDTDTYTTPWAASTHYHWLTLIQSFAVRCSETFLHRLKYKVFCRALVATLHSSSLFRFPLIWFFSVCCLFFPFFLWHIFLYYTLHFAGTLKVLNMKNRFAPWLNMKKMVESQSKETCEIPGIFINQQ